MLRPFRGCASMDGRRRSCGAAAGHRAAGAAITVTCGLFVFNARSVPVAVVLEACLFGAIPDEIPATAGWTGARGRRALVSNLGSGAPAVSFTCAAAGLMAPVATTIRRVSPTDKSEKRARHEHSLYDSYHCQTPRKRMIHSPKADIIAPAASFRLSIFAALFRRSKEWPALRRGGRRLLAIRLHL